MRRVEICLRKITALEREGRVGQEGALIRWICQKVVRKMYE